MLQRIVFLRFILSMSFSLFNTSAEAVETDQLIISEYVHLPGNDSD